MIPTRTSSSGDNRWHKSTVSRSINPLDPAISQANASYIGLQDRHGLADADGATELDIHELIFPSSSAQILM
jgi:hypothetical protein